MKDNPFRSTKIHGYHKGKHDNTASYLRNVPLVGFYLIMIRVAVIGVMLSIAEYMPNIKGLLDFTYHFVDDVAWFTVGMYLFIYHKNIIGYKYHMHLERISYVAFIAASLNIVATLAYGVIQMLAHYWLGVYYFLELMIWTILTIFFYNYWKHCKHSHKHSSTNSK